LHFTQGIAGFKRDAAPLINSVRVRKLSEFIVQKCVRNSASQLYQILLRLPTLRYDFLNLVFFIPDRGCLAAQNELLNVAT